MAPVLGAADVAASSVAAAVGTLLPAVFVLLAAADPGAPTFCSPDICTMAGTGFEAAFGTPAIAHCGSPPVSTLAISARVAAPARAPTCAIASPRAVPLAPLKP